MALNSIHTNTAQIIALQAFSKVNSLLDNAQKRISTGYRVSDATDDGAAFAVAQGLRASVNSLDAVGERLASTKGLLTLTQDALTQISNKLTDFRVTATKLADTSLSTDERATYSNDALAIRNDMARIINGASFNGHNLLDNANTLNVLFDAQGNTLTLTGQDIANQATTLLSGIPNTANGYRNAIKSTGRLTQLESIVNTSLATIGHSIRTVQNQMDFLGTLQSATTAGIGSIVDADLAKESANIQALQIRQQLSLQTLSIANQAPSFLLNLFNNR